MAVEVICVVVRAMVGVSGSEALLDSPLLD